MAKNEKGEKVCLACKRVITGKSKLGLCPECAEKGGSIALVAVGTVILTNGKKIGKVALDVLKNIKG